MNISRNMLLAAFVTFSLPVFAGEAQKPAETTEAAAAETKSFGAKVWGAVTFPVVFAKDTTEKSIDWVAGTFGIQRFVTWLGFAPVDKDGKPAVGEDGKEIQRGRIASFVSNHPAGLRRSLTLMATAAVVAGAYQAYQTFVAEEDNGDEYAEEVDVLFSEDEFAAEN